MSKLPKVGMLGGKFFPVHQGHVKTMITASTLVEELHVIVSFDPEYEKALCEGAKIEPIPPEVRVRWWRQITRDMPHVHVYAVYEPQIGEEEDWAKGAEGIKAAIGKPIDVVFSSESAYGVFFEKLYPGAEHIVVEEDRATHPISATQIREDGPFKH